MNTPKLNTGKTTTPKLKQRKHALAGHGVIVDRARRALALVAEQFGTVSETSQTEVRVTVADGSTLTLSYDPGNYIFSRVYNLTVTAELPADSPLPAAKLIHRRAQGSQFVRADGSDSPALARLNHIAAPHLRGIDVHSARITSVAGAKKFTVTPLGGSYVWVLIPPIFKATAFPPQEPERILKLIAAVRGIGPAPAGAPNAPGTDVAARPAPTTTRKESH